MAFLIDRFNREWVQYLYENKLEILSFTEDLINEHDLSGYTSPTLLAETIQANTCFISNHGLAVSDVKKIFHLSTLIELRAKHSNEIELLDNIETDEYKNAVYVGEYYRNGKPVLCQSASIHISTDKNDKIYHSVSGGTFPVFNTDNLVIAGYKNKRFWCWGNSGACANGGIYFNATVKNFKLKTKD